MTTNVDSSRPLRAKAAIPRRHMDAAYLRFWRPHYTRAWEGVLRHRYAQATIDFEPCILKNSAVTENPTLHRVFIRGIPD
jgi:hypothetical protein